MLLPQDQRRLLGAFLRRRRELLRAADVGLHASRTGRRRTPGLRREEVAEICGMSPTWYAWIEQGRDISVSADAFARLADAMRFTPAERAYLFQLTRRRAWNAPAAELFVGWLEGDERCLLDYVFLDRAARALIVDWENRARRLVAEFRADTGRNPDDPALSALVDRLRTGSADFAKFWGDHAVLAREGGARTFNHPRDGLRHYQQVTLAPAGRPDTKLVMLLPSQDAEPA